MIHAHFAKATSYRLTPLIIPAAATKSLGIHIESDRLGTAWKSEFPERPLRVQRLWRHEYAGCESIAVGP